MELYPEKKSDEVHRIEKFTFSVDAIPYSKQDTDWQIEALETRLNKLIEKYQISYQGHPFPVIEHILKLTHNKEELKGVAKALDRVADIAEALDKLYARRQVIALAEEDTEFFVWAFANVDQEIDSSITNILADNPSANED